MNHPLDAVFSAWDEFADFFHIRSRSRFGSNWRVEDGIILYPANGTSSTVKRLLAMTLPGIAVIECGDNDDGAVNLGEACKSLPAALFVLCVPEALAPGYFGRVSHLLTQWQSNNTIVFRQLGEFLPAGDKKSRAYDVYRKSVIPALPKNRLKVYDAYALFRDSHSRTLFTSIIKRYMLSSDTLIPVSDEKEYFSKLYSFLPEEIFVDCGAYSGDTLCDFLELGGNVAEYHAFEPDPDNFAKLRRYVESLPEQISSKAHLYPNAISFESETIMFSADGNMESGANPNGDLEVSCVTLDEILQDCVPTLMKFDVEGYEAFALQGGRKTIARSRPVIALSVYHHPFDLWDLPLMVNNMVEDYVYFLRAYQEQYSYICYCVPNERSLERQN